MIIKQYVSDVLESNMFLVIENRHAIVIDPCVSFDALQELYTNADTVDYILLTHEHYDHISGVNWLKENYSSSNVMCTESCANRIRDARKNHSRYYEAFSLMPGDAFQHKKMKYIEYVCYADRTYSGYYRLEWEGHVIEMSETPGHSKGSSCIIFDDECMFPGDTLLLGNSTMTRLPGGDKKEFEEITKPFMLGLPKNLRVYPGHNETFKYSDYIWG